MRRRTRGKRTFQVLKLFGNVKGSVNGHLSGKTGKDQNIYSRVLDHLRLAGKVQQSGNVEESFGAVVQHREDDGNAGEADERKIISSGKI